MALGPFIKLCMMLDKRRSDDVKVNEGTDGGK
jgi:hypothetical protein